MLVFTLIGSFFGIIDTIYQLAFMSLFPETISEGNHSRAYSLSSLIWPLSAAVMAPVATFMIENIQDGIALSCYLMVLHISLLPYLRLESK